MRGLGTDIGDSVEAEPLDTIIDEEDQEPATKAVPDEGAPRNLLVPNPQPPPWYFVFFQMRPQSREIAQLHRLPGWPAAPCPGECLASPGSPSRARTRDS